MIVDPLDPIETIVLNNASPALIYHSSLQRHNHMIDQFEPFAECGRGRLETPLGLIEFDLSIGPGEAVISHHFDGASIALSALVWDECFSPSAWDRLLNFHRNDLPAGTMPHSALARRTIADVPWLALAFDSHFFSYADTKNQCEASTLIWGMAQAILRVHRRRLAFN